MTDHVVMIDQRLHGRIARVFAGPVGIFIFVAGFLPSLLAGIGLLISGEKFWATIAGLGAAFCFSVLAFAIKYERVDSVKLSNSCANRLREARNVWRSLPEDLQKRTRPIIDAAFAAAQLPTDAYQQILLRQKLLEEFAAQVRKERAEAALAGLGDEDLVDGRMWLKAYTDMQARHAESRNRFTAP